MENQEIKKENLMPISTKYYDCWDKTGLSYTGMFPAETDMRAIRFIEDAVSNPKSALYKHPEDYRLDYICEIDKRTGEVIDNNVRKILEVSEYGELRKNQEQTTQSV